MAKKLYVGNLSDDTTEEDLLDNFGDMGNCISATIIKDKRTGQSKGFAFVEMKTQEEALKVVKLCKGVELDGKKLVVSEARVPSDQNNPRRPLTGKRN